MARKKTAVAPQGADGQELAQEAATTTTEESPAHPGDGEAVQPQPQAQQPAGNGEAKRPAMSWAVNSDRTTRLEVSAWVNVVRTQQGEEFEQVNFSISRSYKTDDGWQRGGGWRTHDVPVLTFLLQQGYDWAIGRRMTVKTDGDSVPF